MFIFVLLSIIALNNGASIMRDAQGNLATKREEIVDENAEITLPKLIQRLGKLGVNFDLDVNSTENDKQNKPYINCMEYNFNTCQSEDPTDCYAIKKCYQGTPTHLLGCMAVLVYNTLENGSHPDELQHQHPHVMGCWMQDEREMAECQSETECIVDMRRTGSIERTAKFCCCRTHNCNSKFTYRNVGLHEPDETDITTTVSPQIDGPERWLLHIENLALILFPLICIALTYFLVACLRRKFIKQRIKQIQPASKGTDEPLIQKVDEITLGDGSKIEFKDIELLNEISNGRFGQVHRAKLGESILAVKIFPANEKDSWVAEMGIYDAVHKAAFGGESIAEFIGGFQRDENYWILTTFYEKLSLFDFLKANIVTLSEAIRMISTMLDGLAFLHEEIPSTIGNETKPIIVHRDLKSKNILVKDDLRTCITDFGLALKCDTRGVPTDQNHGQVGTRRYMSPEVLEGATEFSSFAFQQIDVYAAALVIWEIISRTALTEGEEIPDYMLPYEKEVGSNPTPNQMRELVATQKYRPQVRMALLQNEISVAIVRTMGEMWDQEPDGRITSSCARDRSRQWLSEVSMSSIGTSSTTPIGP